jgi:GT2 family glycosyltransferase
VEPSLSFIVPVRNDAARLRRCLESIRASASDIPIEIIVIDNGSTDESRDVARAAGACLLELPARRVAELRNLAASHAAADVLAFVDADHEIDPDWANAALGVFEDPSVVAAGAPYSTPADGTWVQRTYDRFRRRQPGSHATRWLPSGNLVVRREAFERVGGFDVSLEACEDVDLCQRLRVEGRLVSASALRSVHHGDPSTLKGLFLGELWRGRDNLRVSLRAPVAPRSLPSIVIPVLNLLSLVGVIVGAATWPGGRPLAAAGIAFIALSIVTRAAALLRSARSDHPAESPGGVGAVVVVAAVYEAARALALVLRNTPERRRRA